MVAILIPSIAAASDWVELAKTPQARIMLDKKNIATFEGGAKASLMFIYHKRQPGQTITLGKPFDSSINQYYLACSTKQFQVLELTVFNNKETVGTFHAKLDLNNLLDAKPETSVMFLLNKLCK